MWTDGDGEVRQVGGDVSVDPTPFERDGDLADEEGYLAARENREAPFSPAGLLRDDLGVTATQGVDALVRADGHGDVLWANP